MSTLPEWAVSEIINRAGRGIERMDVERIVSGVLDEASHAFGALRSSADLAMSEAQRPSVLYRPGICVDGNQWCALYGENLQDGVAGFGDSPAEAMAAFDRAWLEKLPQR